MGESGVVVMVDQSVVRIVQKNGNCLEVDLPELTETTERMTTLTLGKKSS